ncbi:MAG: transposase [Casimicrobiaceae bacterium]
MARTVRTHRELLFNYFRARKEFSSGVIEGLNDKAKITMRKRTAIGASASPNSRCFMYLASYPSQSSPTTFTDEPYYANYANSSINDRKAAAEVIEP